MNNRLSLFVSLALAVLAMACTKTPALEKMAYQRLPKILERTMLEELSIPGGADIVAPTTVYSCDSLCIIQFKAAAKDAQYEGYSFPVRYALVLDVIMSHAVGHPVYGEFITGCPDMDKAELKELKAKYKKDAVKNYAYYSAMSFPIAPEDL